MKKKTLLTSILTIVMCLSLSIGATFALFTSQSEVDISVTSGNVNVKATASELDTNVYSGSATKVGNKITVERLVPGDSFSFDIEIENYSDVAVQYRTVLSSTDGGLFTALKVTITDGEEKRIYNGGYVYEDWAMLSAGDADATTAEHVKTLNVLVEFPDTGVPQNEYQGKSCTINVLVEAIQGNASVVNPVTKISDAHYQINDAKGMMLINGIASSFKPGEGKTILFELTDDVDMTGYAWSPISTMWVQLEGNNHTISNLNCLPDDAGKSGLFGYLGGGYVKNLTLENVTAEGTQAGVVAGSFEGAMSNVKILGTNSVKYVPEHNLSKHGGVGAVAGVAQYVPNDVVIEGNVTVDYNGLVTGVYLKNSLSQITDISTGVTGAENVVEKGTPTRGYIVSNDQELANVIGYINAGKDYYDFTLVNEPITIVMKAGVYSGNYQLNQFPTWDGSTKYPDYNTADKTFVTFLGEDGVEFRGRMVVIGQGNGEGGAEKYNAETKFINIAFDASDVVLPGTTDRYNTDLLRGADNVTFENCSFANSTHVKVGSTKIDKVGDVSLINCNFKNSGCITGGFATLNIKGGVFDGSDNGFVNAQRGGNGDTTGHYFVDGITVRNCEAYAFRTMDSSDYTGKFEISNSSFEILYNEVDAMSTLVCFRGPSDFIFTNCEIKADTYVEYKGNNANASNTSITIDGAPAASLVEDGDTYRVYDINGLLQVNSLIANYKESGMSNLQFISGKTISIERDINANGKVWENVVLNDSHGKTSGFTFDGNGHTISNLVINGAMFANHAANQLYGPADPTIFKDLTFDNVTVTGSHFTAVIWAEMYGEIEINNVKIVNSNISGYCNVAAFIGRNGNGYNGGEIKFVNCSVDNTIITANADANSDPAGANSFVGAAFRGGNTTLKLTFEGTNSATNVNLINNEFVQGGGVYTTTGHDGTAWLDTEVVNNFENYVSYGVVASSGEEAISLIEEAFSSGNSLYLDATDVEVEITEQKFYFPGGSTIIGAKINASSMGGSYLIVGAGSDVTTFENCTFKRGDTGANIVAGDVGSADIVFNNCVFEGPVMPNLVDNSEATITFNNCEFYITTDALIKSGYVNCMGGTHIFKNCTFDFTGGNQGSSPVVKYNAVNSYSEDYSTNVILEGCTFINCGTQKYGANSTLTTK